MLLTVEEWKSINTCKCAIIFNMFKISLYNVVWDLFHSSDYSVYSESY